MSFGNVDRALALVSNRDMKQRVQNAAIVLGIVLTVLLTGCYSPVNPHTVCTITSIKILSGENSKVSDGVTYVFEARGSVVVRGWSVNPTHLGDTLCLLTTDYVVRAQNADCTIDFSWFGTVTEESAK